MEETQSRRYGGITRSPRRGDRRGPNLLQCMSLLLTQSGHTRPSTCVPLSPLVWNRQSKPNEVRYAVRWTGSTRLSKETGRPCGERLGAWYLCSKSSKSTAGERVV